MSYSVPNASKDIPIFVQAFAVPPSLTPYRKKSLLLSLPYCCTASFGGKAEVQRTIICILRRESRSAENHHFHPSGEKQKCREPSFASFEEGSRSAENHHLPWIGEPCPGL